MKKIILILGIIVVFLMGCGKNIQTDNKQQSLDKNREQAEMEQFLDISEDTPFYGGIAAIEDANGNSFVIDKKGNILSELPDEIRKIGKEHNNEVIFFNDIASVSHKLINSKGEIVASPEKTGYTGLFTPFVDGYAIAYYLEESYPSSVIKVGVINGSGEWSVPLSEKNKLLKYLLKDEEVCDDDMESLIQIFKYSSNNIQIDGSKDTVKIETYVAEDEYINDIDYAICFYEGENIISIRDNLGFILKKYDMVNDKFVEMEESNGLTEPPVNGTQHHTYDFISDGSVSDGNVTFKVIENDSGKLYCSVYDRNDKEIMKPTDLEDTFDKDCKCIYVGEDGFVIQRGETVPSYIFYGLDGKKKMEYKDEDGGSWEYMTPFYDGIAFAKNFNGKGKFIDKSGKVIIE